MAFLLVSTESSRQRLEVRFSSAQGDLLGPARGEIVQVAIKIAGFTNGSLGYLSGGAEPCDRFVILVLSRQAGSRVASARGNDTTDVPSLCARKANHTCSSKPFNASL